MTNEVHELTPSGRIKKPSYSLVCSWVKDAWEKIDTNLIRRSFKCCGISVKTDGSEDDMIFDYDSLIVDKENKKNDELIGDNEFREEEFREEDYNNWDDINFANV
jgi:hypothetical protein